MAASTHLLEPLRRRDFRVLWAGMTISLVGDGIMLVALAWLVLTISNTPATLAVVGVAMSLPHVGLALVGGLASDRFDRRKVMIAADARPRRRAPHARGVGDHRPRAALAPRRHRRGLRRRLRVLRARVRLRHPRPRPRRRSTQANSLDQFIRPVATRLAGPMLGGFLVAAVGPGWAITANAVTFALSIFCVGTMEPIGAIARNPRGMSAVAEVRECYRFVRARVWLWGTLLSSSIACLLFLGPSEVLLPFLVKHDLHASASMLGAVFAFGGLGAISAAVVVGRRGLPARHITFMYCAWAASTIAVAGYGLAHFTWQLMAACFVFNAARERRPHRVGDHQATARTAPPARPRLEPRLVRRDRAHAHLVRPRRSGGRRLRRRARRWSRRGCSRAR